MTPVFAFLDIEHPVIAWETYRGVLVSANAEYVPPDCPISMMFAGMLISQNNVRLQNELLIEKFRQLNFPQYTSRLRGMFVFEDESTASRAYEWGGHFHPDNLVELELSVAFGSKSSGALFFLGDDFFVKVE